MLGTGLGMSSVSPWSGRGASATTFGTSTILWLTLTQLLGAGLGGYLAGRLRARWASVHTDEVYFRDTAHGFLAWAVATLFTAAALTSAIGTVVSSGVQGGAAVGGSAVAAAAGPLAMGVKGAAESSNGSESMNYFVDALFRKQAPPAAAPGGAPASEVAAAPSQGAQRGGDAATSPAPGIPTAEVVRIFINSMRSDPLPLEDLGYVSQLVAQHTGLSKEVAQKRVVDIFARAQEKFKSAEASAKETADQARKASAYAALWMFISLLIGAFVASLAATLGGRQRDL
jgi:hypothetical protein